jgi:hypothetical protein
MVSDDVRRAEAEHYIRVAIELLKAAQSKRLDHTDGATVKDAILSLGIVQRSIAGAVLDETKTAVRLREVATKVRSCVEPVAVIAYPDVVRAAGIFQAMADGM